MDRLQRTVLADGGDRIVERGYADTAAGPAARQHGAERRAEPGHTLLHAQARLAETPGQVGRAQVLLVREFGMSVHERDGAGHRRPLRHDGGDDLRIRDGHAHTLRRPPVGPGYARALRLRVQPWLHLNSGLPARRRGRGAA